MTPYPGATHNACAGIDPIDQQRLREAAERLIEARGVFMEVIDTIGAAVVSVGGSATRFLKETLGIDLADRAERITETILWRLQSGAMLGLDPENRRDPWDWFHKLAAGISGATAGFVGEPGLLWDLPLTTGIIMRSVAEIARSFPNEDILSDDTKRACIEVLAFGGLESRDEEADVGYWAARASLSHTSIEGLIRGVASRFGILLTDKMVGQVIPIAGAVAGAGINYLFIDYFQQMARVHFAIREVERRAPDPSAVRPCFNELVRAARDIHRGCGTGS